MRPKISFDEHRRWLRSSGLAQAVDSSFAELREKIKETVFGPGTDFFVGSGNYPEVGWGPMVALAQVPNTRDLYGADYGAIIAARASLLHGRKYGGIRPEGRMIDASREIAMSRKPVDVELAFTKQPNLEMNFSRITQPMGAGAPIRKLLVADNPSIPKKVDQVVGDGLLAEAAVGELRRSGFDNYYLTTLLSSGILGRRNEDKKLVPTRWSITATDDMLAKGMMEEIRQFPELDAFVVFSNEYLFNHFMVLLIPGKWEFENFEAWAPNTSWGFSASAPTISEEHEPFGGRTKYADKQAGGYYASRLGVCEYLHSIRKQARVVVFREIGEGYQIPVGVWEVRENVRHALMGRGTRFSTLQEALGFLKANLRVPLASYLAQAKVVTQGRLTEFF